MGRLSRSRLVFYEQWLDLRNVSNTCMLGLQAYDEKRGTCKMTSNSVDQRRSPEKHEEIEKEHKINS